MLLINCPWCGERDQTEFACRGEAHIIRPEKPEELSDEAWGDYVFFRNNPKGVLAERWVHQMGCRRWFYAIRHTVSDNFWRFYKPGDAKPAVPDDWQGARCSHGCAQGDDTAKQG